MSFDPVEKNRIEMILENFFCKHNLTHDIKNKPKRGFTVDSQKQTIELFEILPKFMNESRKINFTFAKASYSKKNNLWNIYWLQSNSKWCLYKPCPEVTSVEDFLRVVKVDAFGCFFG